MKRIAKVILVAVLVIALMPISVSSDEVSYVADEVTISEPLYIDEQTSLYIEANTIYLNADITINDSEATILGDIVTNTHKIIAYGNSKVVFNSPFELSLYEGAIYLLHRDVEGYYTYYLNESSLPDVKSNESLGVYNTTVELDTSSLPEVLEITGNGNIVLYDHSLAIDDSSYTLVNLGEVVIEGSQSYAFDIPLAYRGQYEVLKGDITIADDKVIVASDVGTDFVVKVSTIRTLAVGDRYVLLYGSVSLKETTTNRRRPTYTPAPDDSPTPSTTTEEVEIPIIDTKTTKEA